MEILRNQKRKSVLSKIVSDNEARVEEEIPKKKKKLISRSILETGNSDSVDEELETLLQADKVEKESKVLNIPTFKIDSIWLRIYNELKEHLSKYGYRNLNASLNEWIEKQKKYKIKGIILDDNQIALLNEITFPWDIDDDSAPTELDSSQTPPKEIIVDHKVNGQSKSNGKKNEHGSNRIICFKIVDQKIYYILKMNEFSVKEILGSEAIKIYHKEIHNYFENLDYISI